MTLARTAPKIRPRLGDPVDDGNGHAGLGLDAVDERVAVVGLPDRARRAREHLTRLGRFGHQLETADRADRGVGGCIGDVSLAAHDVAEAQHLLLAHEWRERAVRLHLGHEEVKRVGPQVERRDAHDSRVTAGRPES